MRRVGFLGYRARLTEARHAGRKTISVDDVMLLSRRNEGLESVLRGTLDSMDVTVKKGGKR